MYSSYEESKKLPIGIAFHPNEIVVWHYLNQGIVYSNSNPKDVWSLETLQSLAKKSLCVIEINGDSWTARISE
jgi:hypothetical protein